MICAGSPMSELEQDPAELPSEDRDEASLPVPYDRPEPLVEDPSFERLLMLLKESRAFDFTGYKRPSLIRRVRHRMGEIGVSGFDDYADVLQLQPTEFTELLNTILINVTSFFRDPDAWGYLRDDVLPGLVDSDDGPIRVWSAGSAAGQEAYSIAMLLHDLLGKEFRDRVKIYATDVDEEALNHARQATYTERDLVGLPASYRKRYLDTVGGRHVITPDLRRSVIFGRNDLTRDAPISRIDVLLCRNTLMYFNAETQARIVHRLAFALRPEGVLFLGKAEMLLNHSAMFEPLDLKHRFFRRLHPGVRERSGTGPSVRQTAAVLGDEAARLRLQLLLTNPVAQIAVGADGRLAMVNYRAAAMLGVSDRDLGRPFQDLEMSFRPVELRSHLSQAIETRAPVWLREVEWRHGPDPVYLDIQIVPLLELGGQVVSASFSFTDVTRFRQLRVEVEETNRQLEVAYEELQSTNEELETTNEELQSTVEELETTNEELQSTNEELETMNEELQSANDEMQSTNEQLRDRTAEVGELNAFMLSILSSFDGAVIVVDADLVVQVWTPQTYELWGLRADEAVGQHLLNLDSGLPATQLHPWLRSVIQGQQDAVVGQPLEAVNRLGRPVRLRVAVTPLRNGTDPAGGALIVMEDAEALPDQGRSSSAPG
jgi:two-component system CheB/CheR fusion protein